VVESLQKEQLNNDKDKGHKAYIMTDTIFLSESNTVAVVCSICTRKKVVDMTQYLSHFGVKKLKVSCKCGNTWTANLEKRRHPRKPTKLPGYFVLFQNEKWIDSGKMFVTDISQNGLRLRLKNKNDLKVGDWLEVDFRLNNKPETYIFKMVQVKNINSPFVGAAFENCDCHDPDIGFYLQGKRTQSRYDSPVKSQPDNMAS
jgi:hypothetical protein